LAGLELAGPWGGRLAVAVLACEPSLLAHAGLATTDIAVTACLVAFLYHLRTGRGGGWKWRVGVPAVWYGAAVLAKASGLVFGVIGLVALELFARLSDPGSRQTLLRLRSWGPFGRNVLQITGLGLGLVFAYCGCDWQPEASFVRWAEALP